MKIIIAIDSLSSNMGEVIPYFSYLASLGYEMIPVVTDTDQRNDEKIQFQSLIEGITNHQIITNEIQVAHLITNTKFEAFLILNATGNTLFKISNQSLSDSISIIANTATVNDIPTIIGINERQALDLYGHDIINLLYRDNIYFIPFGQNDYNNPMSLHSDYDLIIDSLKKSKQKEQVLPFLLEYKKIKR